MIRHDIIILKSVGALHGTKVRITQMNVLMLLKPKETVQYIYDDNTLRQGLEKMRAHSYTAIPVISRDGRYSGTVSEGDFLYYIFIVKPSIEIILSI